MQEAKKHLFDEFPLAFKDLYDAHLIKRSTDLENQLYNLEFELTGIGQTLIHWTKNYMHDKSISNKNNLITLKQDYNNIQKDISSKRTELEKYKKMGEYSTIKQLETANFELQARLSELKDDKLVQLLLSLFSSITVLPHIVEI